MLQVKRLTFVISSFDLGGAQRALINMANYWAAQGVEISVITLNSEDKPFPYHADARVKLVRLDLLYNSPNLFQGVIHSIKRIIKLRNAIRESGADAIISFMDTTNILTILASLGLRVPVLVAERTNPMLHKIGWKWELARRLSYPFSDVLVVQTKGLLDWARKIGATKVVAIPNLVLMQKEKCPISDSSSRSIVTLGRLAPEKRFDHILSAFSLLKDLFPEWTLTICGVGDAHADLVAQSKQLDINNRVFFPGRIDKVHEELARHDFFVLSSLYEGFPNALCEAMACGLPAVSYDCPCGPNEIIRHEIDGYLVPSGNIAELANSMERLMENSSLRRTMQSRACEVSERFSMELIMNKWECCIVKAIEGKS